MNPYMSARPCRSQRRYSPVHARLAVTAGLEDLDRHPIPRGHPPPLRRPRADRFDDPDRLVAGDERESAREFAGVLLVVGSAQPARLNPNQRVVVAECGQRDVVDHEATRPFQHQRTRSRGVRHSRTLNRVASRHERSHVPNHRDRRQLTRRASTRRSATRYPGHRRRCAGWTGSRCSQSAGIFRTAPSGISR